MTKLAALFWFALSLAGCNPHSQTTIVQSSVNGRTTLHSEVNVAQGVATFRCIASSSGVCHYAIYADDCHGGACTGKPVHAFGLPVGQRLVDTNQPTGFTPCVGVNAEAATTACTGDKLAANTGAASARP
jgi:hypothetical protein